MNIIGTSYFVNIRTAVRYYEDYGFDKEAVITKIKAGEIHVGPPLPTPGEKIVFIDNGTRYGIVAS